MRAPAAAIVALLVGAAGAAAQDATLLRVDSLAASGRLTDAREALARWRDRHPVTAADVEPADRARALYLEGRLATDAAAAVDSYLAVALGYPTAAVAPAALLRLGQALLAAGDAARAAGYLERLASDYPAASERAAGLLWLARAQTSAGRPDRACNAARAGLAVRDADADLHALLRIEEDAACAPAPDTARADAPRAAPPAAAADAPARFAAQTGAFRNHDTARSLVARLERAGFDARIAFLPASALARVRVGAFRNQAEAEAEAARLRTRGFEAIVVDDVRRERER